MKNNNDYDPNKIALEQNKIDKEISTISSDPTYDGIVDIPIYCATSKKILWILKEVNDDGGYDQRKAFRDISLKGRTNWWKTIDPVIYISYSVLNGFPSYQELSNITEKPEMVNVLKHIAYINIKKEPGGSVSNPIELENAYSKKWKEIIKKQIEMINPDIFIICGKDLNYLWNDLGVPVTALKEDAQYSIEYTERNNQLFIKTYHPAYFMTKMNENNRGEYFDAIICKIKDWWGKQ
jgi:hypothetical protein